MKKMKTRSLLSRLYGCYDFGLIGFFEKRNKENNYDIDELEKVLTNIHEDEVASSADNHSLLNKLRDITPHGRAQILIRSLEYRTGTTTYLNYLALLWSIAALVIEFNAQPHIAIAVCVAIALAAGLAVAGLFLHHRRAVLFDTLCVLEQAFSTANTGIGAEVADSSSKPRLSSDEDSCLDTESPSSIEEPLNSDAVGSAAAKTLREPIRDGTLLD